MTARVDPATGVYVGTARAFVAGLETARGTVDLASSTMQVTARPGRLPTVTYRIGVSGQTVASGVDIPYERLTQEFNNAVERRAESTAVLDSFGLTLIGPTSSLSEYEGQTVLNAPFLELTPSAADSGAPPVSARLVNIAFDGLYPR